MALEGQVRRATHDLRQKVAKLYDARKVAGWKRHEWKPVGLVRGLLIPPRVGAKPPS